MAFLSSFETEAEARSAFFEIHYGTEDERDGRIGFYAGSRDGSAVKTVSYAAEGESFGADVARLKFHSRVPYYVTPNAFSKNERCSERLFRLKNVVVDADAHGGTDGDRIDAACDALEAIAGVGAFEDYGIPMPNTIVRTGRGAQLWFRIEDCSASLKWMYDAVARFLCEQVGSLMKDYPALAETFEVDSAASGRAAGIARLPGSWNAKAGRKGSFKILHDVRTPLPELYEDAKAAIRKEEAARTSFGFRKSISDVLAERRVEAMRRLIEFRKRRGTPCEGSRDLILLTAYCAMMNSSMTEDEADACVSKLNESFENPLEEREWRRFLSTAKRKKYRFTTKKITEMLSLTEEEQEEIGLGSSGKRSRTEKAAAAEKRDAEIRRLCEAGKSKKEIAALSSCSEQTVARRLKAMGLKTEKERRAEAALRYAVLGGAASEIAARFGYGRSRAAEIAAKAKKIVERDRFRRLRKQAYASAAAAKEESLGNGGKAGFHEKIRKIPEALRIIGSIRKGDEGRRLPSSPQAFRKDASGRNGSDGRGFDPDGVLKKPNPHRE